MEEEPPEVVDEDVGEEDADRLLDDDEDEEDNEGSARGAREGAQNQS